MGSIYYYIITADCCRCTINKQTARGHAGGVEVEADSTDYSNNTSDVDRNMGSIYSRLLPLYINKQAARGQKSEKGKAFRIYRPVCKISILDFSEQQPNHCAEVCPSSAPANPTFSASFLSACLRQNGAISGQASHLGLLPPVGEAEKQSRRRGIQALLPPLSCAEARRSLNCCCSYRSTMAGGTAAAVLALALLLLSVFIEITEGFNVAVLVQGEGGDGGGYYFPLAGAVASVTRLAIEHIGEAAAAVAPGVNVTLTTAVADEGIGAVADLCLSLDRDEDTVAVR